jgi:hypothetical protein
MDLIFCAKSVSLCYGIIVDAKFVINKSFFNVIRILYLTTLSHESQSILISMNQISPNTLSEDHISNKSHLKGINHYQTFDVS